MDRPPASRQQANGADVPARRGRVNRRFTGRGLEGSGSPDQAADQLTNRAGRLTKGGRTEAMRAGPKRLAGDGVRESAEIGRGAIRRRLNALRMTGIVHGGLATEISDAIPDTFTVRDNN